MSVSVAVVDIIYPSTLFIYQPDCRKLKQKMLGVTWTLKVS